MGDGGCDKIHCPGHGGGVRIEERRIRLGRRSAFKKRRTGIITLETGRHAVRIEEHATDIAPASSFSSAELPLPRDALVG